MSWRAGETWIRDKGVVRAVLDAAGEDWKVNLAFSNVEVLGDTDELFQRRVGMET